MTISTKNPRKIGASQEQPTLITAKSGLTVNVLDDVWQLLPNKGKGHQIPVAWVHDSAIPAEDRSLIIEVLSHYARKKAASTASSVVINTKPFLANGIPQLTSLKAKWSGLKTNNKKGLNQFFGTLTDLGHQRFDEYHKFTSSHLDPCKFNPFDPSKGALSDLEFDSLAKQINNKLREFDWSAQRDISFFRRSNFGFGELRNCVSNKLILSIVRRPIQLSVLKWADAIPVGASFHDTKIRASDEIGTIGAQTFQLRVFHAKAKKSESPRAFPERYPIYLSEELSATLLQYKKLCLAGVSLLLASEEIKVDQAELLSIMNDIPMFPAPDFFSVKVESIQMFKCLFTPNSTAFHASEGVIATSIRHIEVASDRIADCVVTNNRLRHTVMTRGAQEGLPAVQLAKITGVTVPAARHYVDMDYKSRRLIDTNYMGNEFLKRAFSSTITEVLEDEEIIVDHQFNEVGGARCKRSCRSCSTELGKPLGCYGCPNFRPILEADHSAVLLVAEDKLRINQNSLLNPLHPRSIERLQRQIEWVTLTITLCNEILAKQRAVDAK